MKNCNFNRGFSLLILCVIHLNITVSANIYLNATNLLFEYIFCNCVFGTITISYFIWGMVEVLESFEEGILDLENGN